MGKLPSAMRPTEAAGAPSVLPCRWDLASRAPLPRWFSGVGAVPQSVDRLRKPQSTAGGKAQPCKLSATSGESPIWQRNAAPAATNRPAYGRMAFSQPAAQLSSPVSQCEAPSLVRKLPMWLRVQARFSTPGQMERPSTLLCRRSVGQGGGFGSQGILSCVAPAHYMGLARRPSVLRFVLSSRHWSEPVGRSTCGPTATS